jgi:hypothetical protein
MQFSRIQNLLLAGAIVLTALVAPAFSQTAADASSKDSSKREDVSLLKQQVAEQQKEIEQLRAIVDQMKQKLDQFLNPAQTATTQAPSLGQVASTTPMVPKGDSKALAGSNASDLHPMVASAAAQPIYAGAMAGRPAVPAYSSPASPGAAPVTQAQMEGYTERVDQLDKGLKALNKGLAGFKLSGDLRLRSDNIFRSSNSVTPTPQQNVRARYRLRLNVDKAVDNIIDTHLQLSSGTYSNPLTFDTDFSGTISRGPLFISEVYGDVHPNQNLSFLGGKMSEVFADNARFLIDDDIRVNGFQEIAKSQSTSSSLGKVVFEFRAGQYIFTNPNVQVLPSAAQCASATPPANCAYVSAGYTPGQKVPSTNMFDQGIVVTASPSERWTHQFTMNVELWRNPNSIQLASVAAGYPVLANTYYGLTLAGPISGTGNGTTTKGGAIYTANSFHVGQVAYRFDFNGWKSRRQAFPVSLEFHGAKNFGADFYGNAAMGQIAAGETKKFGDVAFKYGFFYKEANSMISQITDDDVGTGTGVNLRTHMLRMDVGLNKHMAWQNLVFIQNELAGNDPARNFYVPVVKGTGTLYRYQGQLQFTF